MKIIALKSEFEYRCRQYLGNSSGDLDTDFSVDQKMIKIKDVQHRDDFILLKTNIKGEEAFDFKVTYFDDQRIVLVRSSKNKMYSVILNR